MSLPQPTVPYNTFFVLIVYFFPFFLFSFSLSFSFLFLFSSIQDGGRKYENFTVLGELAVLAALNYLW